MKLSKKILSLLSDNAKYSCHDIAVMLGVEEAEVSAKIREMEQQGIIRKYKAVVDWERFDDAFVSALIELKVTPQPHAGFEEIARDVMKYDEVETVYLGGVRPLRHRDRPHISGGGDVRRQGAGADEVGHLNRDPFCTAAI